jgi:broad specificity phosphatase PhoE
MAASSATTPTPAVTIPRRHRLILVRHARSAVDPQRNPREWGLTEDGHAAARRLGALGLLDRADAFYAGPEPKMVQTLEPAATSRDRQVQQEPAFSETHSAGWAGDREAFEATVRRFIAQPDEPAAPGWETASAARARFTAGVDQLRVIHEPPMNRDRVLPATLVICTGGRMLTAYLSELLGWSPEDAFTHWQALRMPDLAVLELNEDGQGQIVIPFGVLAA